ncbi:MAG TPA: response regulator [Holophagaceae bacterium]
MPKILVIDDSRMMRLYLRRALEKAGHEVVDWRPLSAMEIPDKVAELAPDLVLCDYQMEGANGATVARMVRRADPELPVLVLTAFHEDQMEANLLRLGVRRVLDKPILHEDLAEAVAAALQPAGQPD